LSLLWDATGIQIGFKFISRSVTASVCDSLRAQQDAQRPEHIVLIIGNQDFAHGQLAPPFPAWCQFRRSKNRFATRARA
jgi:hypothetical protein